MLDRILVRQHKPHDIKNPLDLGALVEAMLFYGVTELVVDTSVLTQLACVWKPEGIVELAEEGFLRLSFQTNSTGIHTENANSDRERHRAVLYSVGRAGKTVGLEDVVPQAFEAASGRRGYARRQAARLYPFIKSSIIDVGFPERAEADLLDSAFVNQAASRTLATLVPEYSSADTIRFSVERADEALMVLTNVDFNLANSLYHRTVPTSHSSLSPAYLMAHILTARETLESAAAVRAEISADATHNAVAWLMVDRALSRRIGGHTRIESFQEFVLDDGRAIREAINSGEKCFPDLIQLLKHGRKFRSWVAEQPADSNLIKEYFQACTHQTWVERLPAKSLRWMLFTGIGLAFDAAGAGGVGTAGGVGLSLMDSFLVDPILRGWRPSHFINRRLRPFLGHTR